MEGVVNWIVLERSRNSRCTKKTAGQIKERKKEEARTQERSKAGEKSQGWGK